MVPKQIKERSYTYMYDLDLDLDLDIWDDFYKAKLYHLISGQAKPTKMCLHLPLWIKSKATNARPTGFSNDKWSRIPYGSLPFMFSSFLLFCFRP